MSELDLIQRNGEYVVTSEAVADGAGIQHASVLRLIDENTDDFEEFGQVRFEIRPGYNNSRVRIALLNEQQATLLMTFQRNTDQVRTFKKALVKAFFEMAHRVTTARPASLEERSLALISDLTAELSKQAAQLEEQAPLVSQARTYNDNGKLTTRSAFAREIIKWALAEGYSVKQPAVLTFLSAELGLFVRGARADNGEATLSAERRGLATTVKGTSDTGHNYATGKLTAEGVAYAWSRITRQINETGALESKAAAA